MRRKQLVRREGVALVSQAGVLQTTDASWAADPKEGSCHLGEAKSVTRNERVTRTDWPGQLGKWMGNSTGR